MDQHARGPTCHHIHVPQDYNSQQEGAINRGGGGQGQGLLSPLAFGTTVLNGVTGFKCSSKPSHSAEDISIMVRNAIQLRLTLCMSHGRRQAATKCALVQLALHIRKQLGLGKTHGHPELVPHMRVHCGRGDLQDHYSLAHKPKTR